MAKTRKVGKKRNLVKNHKSKRYAKGKKHELSFLLKTMLNDVHSRTYGQEFVDPGNPSLVSQIVSHLVENESAATRKIQSRVRGNKIRKLLSRIKTNMIIDNECPLCLEPMTENVATLLPCGHRFHRECIRRAFTGTERKCPVCRVNITN
jgi:hypothetical protein